MSVGAGASVKRVNGVMQKCSAGRGGVVVDWEDAGAEEAKTNDQWIKTNKHSCNRR